MELVKIGIEKTIVSEKMCKTSNSTFIIIIIKKRTNCYTVLVEQA